MTTSSQQAAARLLLVDDDPIALELLSLLVAAEGGSAIEATGGKQAIETLRTVHPLPEVILVDHQMPGICGSDVARAVRDLPTPRPRVIAMSASPLPAQDLALFDGFLPKPVDRLRLQALLNDGSASQQQAWPASADAPSPSRGAAACGGALDPTIVDKLRAIMPPDSLRELYTVYVTDTRQRIAELERCSAAGEEDALRRCAHALKGAAMMTGVSPIAAIAAGLEAGVLPRQDHSRLFHQLRTACDDVEQSMIQSPTPGEAR